MVVQLATLAGPRDLARLGLPVEVDNDANCATVGEWWLGAARGATNVVGITIGSGIFRVPATVAAQLHDPGPVLIAWVLGGLIALFARNIADRPMQLGEADAILRLLEKG